MRRDILVVALLWLGLTLAGEALVFVSEFFPMAAAEEAEVVDDAFRVLMVLAVPVFAFVTAVMLYSIFRFRRRGEPTEDGPAIHTNRPVIVAWFAVTIGLTIFMIIHPGITGVNKLSALASEDVDLVVQVEGLRFAWRITYPEYNVTTFNQELVLPLDNHIRFEVTSRDVLHSFWVPAFRMKIDAVPGLTTTVYATPNRTGSYDDDISFRLQCAELCGVGHGLMTIQVRVVEQGQFDDWIAQQPQSR